MINSAEKSQTNLYCKFTKLDLSSKKNYMVNTYANSKVQYYNDEKKIKNKKIKKRLIIGSVALILLGAVSYAIGSKKFRLPTGNDLENTKNIIEDFGNNTNNIKDETIGRAIDFVDKKTPFKFIKKGFDKFSNWYRSNVYKSVKGKYEKAQEAIKKAEDGDSLKDKLKEFDEMFKKLDESITAAAQNEKLGTKKLFEGRKGKLKNLWHNLSHPLSDAKIAEGVRYNANIIEIPKDASESLKKAIENYNKIQQEELIPKLRDIAYGAAPSDLVTAAVPIATFGIALAKADDKEERKSLLLNLGIPLFPTVTMPILGTIFPILNGIKAMIAGFAVGNIFSTGAKFIDKRLKQKKINSTQT